jgi:hypothetical protein
MSQMAGRAGGLRGAHAGQCSSLFAGLPDVEKLVTMALGLRSSCTKIVVLVMPNGMISSWQPPPMSGSSSAVRCCK